jgi:hypothetical protein
MNIMQYLYPFYYNLHKVISNIEYPHIGLVIVTGFLQPLQFSHIGLITVVIFLHPLQYMHVGP